MQAARHEESEGEPLALGPPPHQPRGPEDEEEIEEFHRAYRPTISNRTGGASSGSPSTSNSARAAYWPGAIELPSRVR